MYKRFSRGAQRLEKEKKIEGPEELHYLNSGKRGMGLNTGQIKRRGQINWRKSRHIFAHRSKELASE